MNTEQVLLQKLQNLVPQLELVYLFGSQADGVPTIESDYDVALLSQKPLSAEQIFELARAYAQCK